MTRKMAAKMEAAAPIRVHMRQYLVQRERPETLEPVG